MAELDISGYRYGGCGAQPVPRLPVAHRDEVAERGEFARQRKTLVELGCGNGSMAQELCRQGWDVAGLDPSADGIAQVRQGHIKFWSMDTLRELLLEAGFVDIRFERVGRIPALAKSLIEIASKP